MFRRRGRRGDPKPEAVYRDLRDLALHAFEDAAPPAPSTEHPDVSGLVVDIPASGGLATLVAMTDDTTSLYTSTGGG